MEAPEQLLRTLAVQTWSDPVCGVDASAAPVVALSPGGLPEGALEACPDPFSLACNLVARGVCAKAAALGFSADPARAVRVAAGVVDCPSALEFRLAGGGGDAR